VDNVDTKYGDAPGMFVQTPTDIDGITNTTIWQIGQVKVTQMLQIVPNPATGQADLGKMSYTVENLDTASHQVGLRIMIDTELNNNDGAPFRVPNTGIVTQEREFVGSNIPADFQVFRSVTEPNYIASVLLHKASEIPPDRLVLVGWQNIRSTAYDYTVNPAFNFTFDSAYAVYWLPQPLEPSESRTYVTYYGLGNVTADVQPPLALAVSGPAALSILDGQYTPNPFEVVATVRNNSENTVAVDNVQLTLNLPAGLTLQGDAAFSVGTLQPGQEVQHSWLVTAAPSYSPLTLNYSVTATGTNTQAKVVTRSVSIPALAAPNAPPYSTSHYMVTTDVGLLHQEGCQEAIYEAVRGNRDALIVLDFGNPYLQNGLYGTALLLLDNNLHFASTVKIAEGSQAFLRGYWECSTPDMRLMLAIGTNNNGLLAQSVGGAQAHGTAWAMMINDLNRWIISHPCFNDPQQMCSYRSRFRIAGAIDIESWGVDGYPAQTRSWVDAYDSETTLPYYDYGTCDDCPTNSPLAPVTVYPSGTTRVALNHLWYVSWGARNAYPIPEIYNINSTHARAWYNLSRYGVVCNTNISNQNCIPSTIPVNSHIIFTGVMTQWQRCTRQKFPCPSTNNAPDTGWQQLFTTLDQDENTRIPESIIKWSTDLIWDSPDKPYP
jgi:hypothetical protein